MRARFKMRLRELPKGTVVGPGMVLGEIPDKVGGDVAVCITSEEPGAMRNGTRVIKANSEAGDVNPNGTAGTILGSTHVPQFGFGYFVEWDSAPGVPRFTVAKKLERAD